MPFRGVRKELAAPSALALATLLFAVVFVARVLDDAPATGIGLLYIVPVALLSLRFGLRGGLGAAAIASLLYIGWSLGSGQDLPAANYVSRSVAFFTLGLLVGYLAEAATSNEARFEIALKHAPITVFTTDTELRYTWAHRSWGGQVKAPLIGKTAAEVLVGDDGHRTMAVMRRALESGKPAGEELVIHRRDGSKHFYAMEVEPLRDPRGRIFGLTGAALDITAERTASEALAASEARFRTAVENMLEPFALYSAVRDERGEIVDFRAEYFNPPAAASIDMTASEMVGRRLTELFPGRLESGLLDEYTNVVESGESLFREAVDYLDVLGEKTLVRAFDIRVSKLGDGVEITWRDITDRMRAERDRDWIASIVDSAAESILSADLNGRIVSWSTGAERLSGYSAEEMIGKHVSVLFEPDAAKEREDMVRRVLAGETIGPMEVVETRKDGTKARIVFTASPIKDDSGNVIGGTRVAREAG